MDKTLHIFNDYIEGGHNSCHYMQLGVVLCPFLQIFVDYVITDLMCTLVGDNAMILNPSLVYICLNCAKCYYWPPLHISLNYNYAVVKLACTIFF